MLDGPGLGLALELGGDPAQDLVRPGVGANALREDTVFAWCRDASLPVALVLAGGYTSREFTTRPRRAMLDTGASLPTEWDADWREFDAECAR